MAANTANLTFQYAVSDVQRYRNSDGLHLPHTPGSLINWAQAQFPWSNYGANNPNLTNEQVVQNFINAWYNGTTGP